MPPVQTNYTSDMAHGLPGLVMNMEPYRLISRLLENGPLMFGAPVAQGAMDTGVIPALAGGAPYMGIAVVDDSVRPASLPDQYATTDTVNIITRGVVWVTASVAVTPRQPAYYDATGKITNVSASNTAIPNASFDRTAAAGGIVPLRLGS